MNICLVGNQNCGKTTLFNLLTGLNQKIGNWPGVTIEKKEGIIKQTDFNLIDLPGIYSLNSYSSEEIITSEYILNNDIDMIINIVDASCFERSLYLTTQLLELDCDVIIALNMVDILEKKKIKINVDKLEKMLGTKVCEISALKNTGIDDLISYIKNYEYRYKIKIYNKSLEELILKTENNIKDTNKRTKAIKFLETNNDEIEEEIAYQRYEYISKIKKECFFQKKRWISNTELLDKIFLNKIFAIPIFIVIMFGIYFLSVGIIGKYTVDFTNELIDNIIVVIENCLKNINTSDWLKSLICDGILNGIATVLQFLPQLCILFFCISILETSGYMSRIAFLLNKIFRKIGLSGKSLIPFILGTGCSVPGIMSTKIIENQDEKNMTTILVPFIPCSAKLPIIALFTGYFFSKNAGLISCSLYFLSIIIIIISSSIMRKYVFANTSSSFISELPDYKFPNLKYVIKDVLEKIMSFVKRAGTTIFLASVIIWVLLSFSFDLKYGINIEESILAQIGKKISWIFQPIIGTNSWEATVSILQGLIAKEQVISSMAIISGFQENQLFSKETAFGFFNSVSAYSFIVFNLFSAPCFAAISAMKNELKSKKKTLFAVFYQIFLAWILSAIIYCIF